MAGQGQLMEALAEGKVLSGTLERLGGQFAMPPNELRACLRELAHAGWIAVQTQPFGLVTVRLERRSGQRRPVAVERRRGRHDAWYL